MSQRKTIKLSILFFLIALTVGCDQASKILVRQKIDYYENISLIKNMLTLTRVENTGAFLSMGDELPSTVRFILLSILPLAILTLGLYYLVRHKNLPMIMQLGLCLLIGGGIGNIIDRIKFGSVTDFLYLDVGIFNTGVFNFADLSIMVGIGLLLIQSFKTKVCRTEDVVAVD